MTTLPPIEELAVWRTKEFNIHFGLNHKKVLAYERDSNPSEYRFFPIVGLPDTETKQQAQEILKTQEVILENGILFFFPGSDSDSAPLQKWLARNGQTSSLVFDGIKITSTDLKTILLWTKTFHSYTHLSFNTRHLFKEGVQEVRILVEILQANLELTSLNIFGNYLGDLGIREFVSPMMEHPSLIQVRLGGNRIGDEGLRSMLPLFGKKSKVEFLDLSSNQITDSVLDALIIMLHENRSLKQLNLKNNPISEEGKIKLRKAFESTPLNLSLSTNTGLISTPKENKKGESSRSIADNAVASSSTKKEPEALEVDVEIPPQFICPLSKQLMHKPVVAADGETYEREMITRVFLTSNLSPVHGVELEHQVLVPNNQLEREIRAFLDKNPLLKNETFIPEGLKSDCIQAMKTRDIPKLKLVLSQDKRLFTESIQGDLTLIDLACQTSPEVLETVINAFPIDNKPKLTHELCIKASESMGAKGVKLLVDSLPGLQILLEHRLVSSIKTGSLSYINSVLDLGADPNKPLKNGNTSFHEASKLGNKRVIDLIMERGGNPRIKNTNGLTPIEIADESTGKYIEQKRLLLKIGPIIDPLLRRVEEQSKTIRILVENQLAIYEALREVSGVFSEEVPDNQKVRMVVATLQSQMRQSLLEGESRKIREISPSTSSVATEIQETEEATEKKESVRTNNLIYLLNETFLLLENVISAHEERSYSQELRRDLISHYASVSLLMRAFHMLGALSNDKKLKDYNVPSLLVDSVKIGKTPNAYTYRNQMMHYSYKFEGKVDLLLQTIKQLSPIFEAIRALRKAGAIDISSFQPISSNSLAIFPLLMSEETGDKIVKDKTLAMRHLKFFIGEMQHLSLEAQYMKKQGIQIWEHDGVLHAAISGLCCAIGQRLRDLKEHHKLCYDDLIQAWQTLDPNLVKKRTICGYECEGTFFEIDRTMWGHVFKEDDERPGLANGKLFQQAAFELFSPKELWERLEFAKKTKNIDWEDL